MSGVHDGLVSPLPDRYDAQTRSVGIQAGERYHFPKFEFHGTHTKTDLVVTLVSKSAQEDAQARILAPYNRPVVHAFAGPYPESIWLPVLAEAQVRLIATWRRLSQ